MNINLKSIETIVLHCASRHDRRAHIDALLQSLGMNYSFFNAYEQGGRVLSATRSLIALIEQRLLITPFRPFLLLEDDISVTPWTESLDIPIPNDADAIYLGISLFSVDPLVEIHAIGVPYSTVEGFRDLVKIDSMLSQHAVLILKPRWLLMLMRAMVTSATLQLPWDIPIARAMSRYQVYAKYARVKFGKWRQCVEAFK